MKKIWKYLTILFAGIIGGLVAAIKILDSKTIVNANNYVNEQNQETKIGKIKQKKGEDNNQSVTQAPVQPASTRKQLRKERKAARKLKRESVLSEAVETDEV